MKKSIVALGIVLALSGCAAAADETLAAEPAAQFVRWPVRVPSVQPVQPQVLHPLPLYTRVAPILCTMPH